jgi:hypothetical protein
MKKTLLIVGDSFSTDWTKKYNDIGWVNLLENDFEITNISQAGVSEYKIYLQLKSIDITKFDKILISHTSAYRIPIEEHPIHKDDLLHNKCDIIFSDVSEHIENPIMKTAYDFYSEIFYPEYFCFVNDLIFNQIKNIAPNSLNITFFDSFYDDSVYKFEDIFLENKGLINHLSEIGNYMVYQKILDLLK